MLVKRAFGVEQEHFIFHDDDTPPTPVELNCVWEQLKTAGYRPRALGVNGEILAVEKGTPWGVLVATSDACTHILEIAFPKLTHLDQFRRLYLDTWGVIGETLRKHGLVIRLGGALPQSPPLIYWRPKETDSAGLRLMAFLNRDELDHPLFARAFPACFAATHINLEIPEREAIRKLRRFYQLEFLIPLFFSNSFLFQGVPGRCVRLSAWTANFAQSYPLLGIPSPLPESLAEYDLLRQTTPLRDYSFIAIRSCDRLEFRTACSQNTVEDILQLIQLRMAIDEATEQGPCFPWEPREAMKLACESPGAVRDWAAEALDYLAPFAHTSLQFRYPL